jgi:hypothetical protein
VLCTEEGPTNSRSYTGCRGGNRACQVQTLHSSESKSHGMGSCIYLGRCHYQVQLLEISDIVYFNDVFIHSIFSKHAYFLSIIQEWLM